MHRHSYLWRVLSPLCRRSIASMTLIALLAGCATMLSVWAAKIADTDEASVAGCEFVGQVKGSSVGAPSQHPQEWKRREMKPRRMPPNSAPPT